MADWINKMVFDECVTNGEYFNAYPIFRTQPPPAWNSSYWISGDYYRLTADINPATVAFYAKSYYTIDSNILNQGSPFRIMLLNLVDANGNPVVKLDIMVVKESGVMYFRVRGEEIATGTTIFDTGEIAGIASADWYNNFTIYTLCVYEEEDAKVKGLGFCRQANNGGPWDSQQSTWNQAFFVNIEKLRNDYQLPDDPFLYEEVSEEYGEASKEGGYSGGTFDDSSDVIAMPPAPSIGVSSAGFVNIYNPSIGQLQQFGSELFPNLSFTPLSPSGTPSSVTDALVSIAEVLVGFGNQIPNLIDMYINSNLIQYVIDCHIIPVKPSTSGTNNVKVGFKTFTPTPEIVTSDYVDFDCGSLNVGEYYANFIDYAPYTRAKLFLPFVGYVDLLPEYWQSGTLTVKYRFNIIDGSFMAFVISTSSKSKLSNSVIAQYGGNACVHIPITGLNYANMVSGIVSAVGGVVSAPSGTAGSALLNTADAVANSKPPVQQSNGYNSTTSVLGVRTPYLLIERSVSNFSRNYTNELGVPSNITSEFSSLSGFTQATNIHLDGIDGATNDDLTEIAELLAEGVIL